MTRSPSRLYDDTMVAQQSVFVWIAVLLVLVIGLFAVVAWLRKRMSFNEDFQGEGFTLVDLRRLHQSGKLSDEEFEKAKAGLIAAAQSAEKRKQEERQNPRDFGVS